MQQYSVGQMGEYVVPMGAHREVTEASKYYLSLARQGLKPVSQCWSEKGPSRFRAADVSTLFNTAHQGVQAKKIIRPNQTVTCGKL